MLTGESIQIAPDLYQLPLTGTGVFLAMEDQITVIDAGFKGSGRRIIKYLDQQGRCPSEVTRIIATHYHTDHIGGMGELKAATGAAVAAHASEIPFLQTGDPLPSPFHDPRLAKLTAPLVHLSEPPAFVVDAALTDGDQLGDFGNIEVVHTPGHTPGSISLYFRQQGALIVGDALEFRGGKLGLPSRLFTNDMEQAKQSIRRLASLDFEVLCFSHFPPLTKDAGLSLRRFAESLD